MKIKVSVTLKKLPTIDYRTLKELQGNLKDLTEKNYAKLLKSLTEFGFIVPFFVWKNGSEFYISDGHQRQRVLIKENATPYNLPYIEIQAKNKQEAKKKLLAISSQYGTITQEGWDEFTFDLDDNWLKDTIQFDGLKNWDVPEATEDDYEIPAEIKTDIKRGDLFQIGEHYLLCGDCTKVEDVKKLMDGKKADMIFTDPPYGMNLDTDFSKIKSSMKAIGHNKISGNKWDKIIGDNEDFSPELIATIFKYFNYCKEIFLFGADYYSELLPNRKNGSWIVWDKRKESQSDAIGSEFEMIWSKQKHKKRILRHDWFGFLSSKNTKDAQNRIHPAQKPISLISDILQQWGKENDLIVDLFLGSGSTMVAAHQLNRRCFGMEIDSSYCAVIIDRMKKASPEIEIKRNGKKYLSLSNG